MTSGRLSPLELARRQLEHDRQQTARFPDLLGRKIGRMCASPFAFLRGAAQMFYEVLRDWPELGGGPPGEGWITGDLHLENFGAYRAEPLTEEGGSRVVIYHLNDFDEAVIGPWRVDLLRLLCSLILAARDLRLDGRQVLGLCRDLLGGYVGAAFHLTQPPAVPRAVTELTQKVEARTRKELLDQRTQRAGKHQRCFLLDKQHFMEVPPELKGPARAAFEAYVTALDEHERPRKEAVEVLDIAQRIAGTGSLGCVRPAVLVRGKGGEDGAWIFDMKEEGTPAAAALLGDKCAALEPAKRVRTALLSCLPQPPRQVGTAHLNDPAGPVLSMLVRRLMPQEDRLDLSAVRPEELPAVACHLGSLVGVAHARGASAAPGTPWSVADREALIEQALMLAGVHEGAYLAYCHVSQ